MPINELHVHHDAVGKTCLSLEGKANFAARFNRLSGRGGQSGPGKFFCRFFHPLLARFFSAVYFFSVQPLPPPEIHFLNAAEGWLGLDVPHEARVELDAIAPEFQNHPDVLEMRWQLHTRLENWEDALHVAQLELQHKPEDSAGWLHHAYALRRASRGGLVMAWGALLPAAQKFPKEPVIAYNLACYACQLKQMETAREWLERAVKVGGREEICKMALADDDLKPLWPEISKL
jgi:hypothetical protein